METWLTEVHCVGAVLGPRQTGKTSLLLKLRHTFQDKYGFAFVDLQAIEGAQADECFKYIAEQIVEQLAATIDGAPTLPKGNTTFSAFLREFARQTRVVRIVVILDEMVHSHQRAPSSLPARFGLSLLHASSSQNSLDTSSCCLVPQTCWS
jgi:Cdc6-like AAA superfamily ATPase